MTKGVVVAQDTRLVPFAPVKAKDFEITIALDGDAEEVDLREKTHLMSVESYHVPTADQHSEEYPITLEAPDAL